jgi:hypothetical protein
MGRMPRIHLELPDRAEDLRDSSTESFDRIAFAQHALALVRPWQTTVAICEGARIHVEAGRQWGKEPGERWAILSVPRDASRRAIARAVLGLATARAPRPWALDVLLHDGEDE